MDAQAESFDGASMHLERTDFVDVDAVRHKGPLTRLYGTRPCIVIEIEERCGGHLYGNAFLPGIPLYALAVEVEPGLAHRGFPRIRKGHIVCQIIVSCSSGKAIRRGPCLKGDAVMRLRIRGGFLLRILRVPRILRILRVLRIPRLRIGLVSLLRGFLLLVCRLVRVLLGNYRSGTHAKRHRNAQRDRDNALF